MPTVLAVVAVLGAVEAFTAVPNIVMLPELFPQTIRVTGMSIVYCCVGVSIFVGVSLLALPLIREPAGRPLD